MKKIVFALLMVLAMPTYAGGPKHGHWDGRHYTHGHWRQGHHGWEWVIPAVIGGIVVYQVTKPPQPVIVQQETVVEPNCSPWTEIQNGDGSITRTRTCRQ